LVLGISEPLFLGSQTKAFKCPKNRVSSNSDWRFSTEHARVMASELRGSGAPVTFQEIASPHGHDSFLFDTPAEYHRTVASYLDRLANQRGIPARRQG
jgi:homoserine acetyltransferase